MLNTEHHEIPEHINVVPADEFEKELEVAVAVEKNRAEGKHIEVKSIGPDETN